jgi:DNA-directed RNA polymerase omega subunit
MIPVEQLTKHGHSVYSIVNVAARRSRTVNDWRLQRSRVLFEDTGGPKAPMQALYEIADGTISIVMPGAEETRKSDKS